MRCEVCITHSVISTNRQFNLGSLNKQLTACSGYHQRKRQSSALLAFCEGDPPVCLYIGPMIRNLFHCAIHCIEIVSFCLFPVPISLTYHFWRPEITCSMFSSILGPIGSRLQHGVLTWAFRSVNSCIDHWQRDVINVIHSCISIQFKPIWVATTQFIVAHSSTQQPL